MFDDAVLYLKVNDAKIITDKRLISTPNLAFLKVQNYVLSALLLSSVCPKAWWLLQLHRMGIACVCTVFTVNTAVLFFLKRNRPKAVFTPLSIVVGSLSLLYVIPIDFATMMTKPSHLKMLALPLMLYCVFFFLMPTAFSWFEDAVLVDVWFFIFLFTCRKFRWFTTNLDEQAELVRFFKTTCFDFIEKAPTAELLYSATTGLCNCIALQLGKVLALTLAQRYEMIPHLQAVYFGGFIAHFYMAIAMDFNGFWLNYYFIPHHTFEHVSAKQYLTKHAEHHDVVPVGSIVSADTGFQEGFHRSISPWQYMNSWLFGFNFIQYFVSVADEWGHNYCPTAKYSSVLALKNTHVDHHFNRTVPLGFRYETEAAERGFKYDTALWENFAKFMPGVDIPEHEDHLLTQAVYEGNQLCWPGGPGWVGPKEDWIPRKRTEAGADGKKTQ